MSIEPPLTATPPQISNPLSPPTATHSGSAARSFTSAEVDWAVDAGLGRAASIHRPGARPSWSWRMPAPTKLRNDGLCTVGHPPQSICSEDHGATPVTISTAGMQFVLVAMVPVGHFKAVERIPASHLGRSGSTGKWPEMGHGPASRPTQASDRNGAGRAIPDAMAEWPRRVEGGH
jgi:hypothetical protein